MNCSHEKSLFLVVWRSLAEDLITCLAFDHFDEQASRSRLPEAFHTEPVSWLMFGLLICWLMKVIDPPSGLTYSAGEISCQILF